MMLSENQRNIIFVLFYLKYTGNNMLELYRAVETDGTWCKR